MELNKLVYALFIIMLVAFLSIYFGTTNGLINSNTEKTVFTEEKIKEFEKDVAEGKNVNIKDYVTNTSKDYSNKITDFGDGMSSFIFDMVNGVLKGSFKVVEKMIN